MSSDVSGDLPHAAAASAGWDATRAWETWVGPTRLIYGPGSLDRLGDLARDLGARKALVVTDPGVLRAGHAGRAVARLGEVGLDPAIFDGVASQPTTRHVEEGVRAARALGADLLVGIGGGSAMDCAKGINFVLTQGGRLEEYWGTGKATLPMLPSLGVPTTAGTGSEAQSYALICQEQTGLKMACGDRKAMFRGVVLDPELLASVPRAAAAAAGIDAVAHAVESHVTLRRNPVSSLFSREAWRLLDGHLPGVVDDPPRGEAWGPMLLGSYLAGVAIEHSMLGAAHACTNPVTAGYPVAHGVVVGLLLPHVIRFNAEVVGRLYEDLLGAVEPGGEATLDERVFRLLARTGLPQRLRDVGVPRAALPSLAEQAERQWTAGFNPRPVARRELLEIYEAAY